jgi:hypothetical protein
MTTDESAVIDGDVELRGPALILIPERPMKWTAFSAGISDCSEPVHS